MLPSSAIQPLPSTNSVAIGVRLWGESGEDNCFVFENSWIMTSPCLDFFDFRFVDFVSGGECTFAGNLLLNTHSDVSADFIVRVDFRLPAFWPCFDPPSSASAQPRLTLRPSGSWTPSMTLSSCRLRDLFSLLILFPRPSLLSAVSTSSSAPRFRRSGRASSTLIFIPRNIKP